MSKVSLNATWDETLAYLRAEQRLLIPLAFGTIFLAQVLGLVILAAFPAMLAGPLRLVVSFWATVGELALIALILRPGSSVREALGTGIARLPVAVIVYLIMFLTLSLLALPVIFAIMQAGYPMEELQRMAADQTQMRKLIDDLPAWSKFYVFALTLAALFVSVRLLLWKQAVVARTAGPVAALGDSWRLTRGRFWAFVGLLILLGIVMLIVGWVVTSVFGSLLTVLVGQQTAALLVGTIGAAVTTLLTLVATVFLTLFYRQASSGT